MIFIDNLSDLQYYNQPAGAPCYCEQLVYPSDLLLQDSFSSLASSFTVQVDVLSADGLTTYEDATSYFQSVFYNYNGLKYFNLQLKSYSPAMCSHLCWILRVRIFFSGHTYFDKYTQRYCITTCCDTPRGIGFTPEEFVAEQPASTTPMIPLSDCGKPLIRIEVSFPCLNNDTGEYYGMPVNVISGTPFSYKKITNIVGRVVQRPREIKREISYNCKLQRTESFKPYLVESTTDKGVFPTWKMNELEGMFHAPDIYVTDFKTENTYQFSGGAICEQIYKCWELFKLKTTLQSCAVRQVFGCNETCATTTDAKSYKFLIPQSYSGGNFYSENRQLIGSYDNLLVWLEGQQNVAAVNDVTEDFENIFAAIEVTGNGFLPSSFYFDAVTPRNKVYGVLNPVSPAAACKKPVTGEIEVLEQICTTPVTGDVILINQANESIAINSYGNWVVDQLYSEVLLSGKYAHMFIKSRNNTLTSSEGTVSRWLKLTVTEAGNAITVPTGDAIVVNYAAQSYTGTDFTQDGTTLVMTNGITWEVGDLVAIGVNITTESGKDLSGEIIGVVNQPGRPSQTISVPVGDATISIEPSGLIRWTGTPTTQNDSYTEVTTEIYYNL